MVSTVFELVIVVVVAFVDVAERALARNVAPNVTRWVVLLVLLA